MSIFEKYGNSPILILESIYDGETDKIITVEELYQSFKERLIRDLLVDIHNVPNFGLLKDKDNIDEGLGD